MPAASPDKLLARIAAGKPLPAVVLLGADTYLRDLCRTRLIETHVPAAARDWAVARFDAEESGWDAVLERAQTIPMLSPHQVVVVQSVGAFESAGEEEGKRLAKSIAAYLGDPAPFTTLVLEAASLDGRRLLGKTLNEHAVVVSLEVEPGQASRLLAEMAASLGASIDPAAAALLIEIMNTDLARIRTEMEKLALYAAGRRITRQDIALLVVSDQKYTVWDLAGMLAAGQRDAALVFLSSLLRNGEQPAGIVGAIAWMFRKLVEARELPPSAGPIDAARALGMRPDAAELAMRQSRRIPPKTLLRGMAALSEADSRLKSGAPHPSIVVEFLLAELTAIS
jgi:DNA polymerase III subunit delta